MRFQPAKCNMMQITRKQIKKSIIYPGENGPRKHRKYQISWGLLSQMTCDGICMSAIFALRLIYVDLFAS